MCSNDFSFQVENTNCTGLPFDESSLVLIRFERTCSLHHSYGYDYSREYAQNRSALRYHFANT